MAHDSGLGDMWEAYNFYGNVYANTFTDNVLSWANPDTAEGALNWSAIYNMSSADMGDYLSSEFGLGSQYLQYITPLDMEPFQAEYKSYALNRDTLMGKTGDAIIDLGRTSDTLAAKSGFASSGQVAQMEKEQEVNIMGDYESKLEGLGIDTMKRVTAEQGRQVEQYYNDIHRILSLDASKEAASSGGGDSTQNIQICFSSNSKVELKSGLKIPMKYLKTGDIVKSNLNGEYSEVVAWLHKDNNEEITFLEIVNEDNEILTVSDSHVIFKNKTNNKETFAGDLNIGDRLQGKKIISINTIVDEGFYAPITLSGEIIVDDYKCSCFAVITHKVGIKIWKMMTAIKLQYLVNSFPSIFEKCIGPHKLFFFPWLAIGLASPFTKTYNDFTLLRLQGRST